MSSLCLILIRCVISNVSCPERTASELRVDQIDAQTVASFFHVIVVPPIASVTFTGDCNVIRFLISPILNFFEAS